jgi:predicted CoA-substrate-specific enzyme activase
MITCGVDIGSTSIEIVLLENGERCAAVKAACGVFPAVRALQTFRSLLASSGLDRSDIQCIIATGFGRNYFTEADKVISEITCHAAGVRSLFPAARSVIEIGGQDSKFISIGENGRIVDFAMNDRCAAGTGRFIETIARTLCIALEETGPMALEGTGTCEISAMCAVFAETEIVGLLHQGVSHGAVLRGVFNAVARRVLGMAARFTLRDQVVFTGGVACNPGVVQAFNKLSGLDIRVPAEPHYTGALGAALLAMSGMTEAPWKMPAVAQPADTWTMAANDPNCPAAIIEECCIGPGGCAGRTDNR